MIRRWSEERTRGKVLENGCGVGEYLAWLGEEAAFAVGIDVEFSRLVEAKQKNRNLVCAVGEALPFKRIFFDLVLSNEVIEHVHDDRQAITESMAVLAEGGRLALFCPNRGYPFETHGIFIRGEYRFGNKLLVNYLPKEWRNRLAPHVRTYNRADLRRLFAGLPVTVVFRTTIFGAYDNIIQRRPAMGKLIRTVFQSLEKTPLKFFGLSHFWVVEKKVL
ncbi:MAG: class I SAM-dependent methyltransferase [Pelolinea sp.]|nr:class I SAM-dependent methyltransferase [Pelolinea sp.]